MSGLTAFARFLYEFVVGDDPAIAAGVVVALGVTAAVGDRAGGGFWWSRRLSSALLAVSLRRASTDPVAEDEARVAVAAVGGAGSFRRERVPV